MRRGRGRYGRGLFACAGSRLAAAALRWLVARGELLPLVGRHLADHEPSLVDGLVDLLDLLLALGLVPLALRAHSSVTSAVPGDEFAVLILPGQAVLTPQV